jgi:hypothetical protein
MIYQGPDANSAAAITKKDKSALSRPIELLATIQSRSTSSALTMEVVLNMYMVPQISGAVKTWSNAIIRHAKKISNGSDMVITSKVHQAGGRGRGKPIYRVTFSTDIYRIGN